MEKFLVPLTAELDAYNARYPLCKFVMRGKVRKYLSLLPRSKGFQSVVLCTIFSFLTSVAVAQKIVVSEVLASYDIETTVLDVDNLQQPNDYSFDLKQTFINTGKTTVTSARYEPSKPENERWTIIDVNGNPPTNKEIKSFRKEKLKPENSPEADDDSYRIEKEDSEYLTVSFKYVPATLSKETSFLNDCRNYLLINLKTKEIQELRVSNDNPLKIKVLNVEKLSRVVKFRKDKQTQKYLILNDDLDIVGKVLGQQVNIETRMEYSSFQKN